ncbi:DegT/DnrJ/EryC1/StrS family aminotransferase [Streptomyces sp. CT34]|uniref:DegT/DnrJ/EryC1/StrS family aminotransferase n=1 Tax=Streptomyces sp. CT34 TaxID=1553907 RepID=UPI0005B84FB7|nr:DegT/DnrJ/EryC1/StrS family aminotransferase [Streptomyces sp. CT34]
MADIPYARPYWNTEEAVALQKVLDSGFWTNGGHIADFEGELERLTGAPVVTMSSGTAAILALLRVLGEQVQGPKLLVSPTLNFAAGPASAKLLGWDVGLCDVTPTDLTVCPDSLAELLDRVRHRYARIVVLPVHYAGHPCDLAAVSAVCERFGADLVEDACHAIGGHHGDPSVPIGSSEKSLAAYFSFHPAKPVATGEGGAIATRDERLLERLRLFRNHNMAPVATHEDDFDPWPYDIAAPGTNLRLSEFHAAVGAVQARRADETRRERARLAARYHEALAGLPAVRTIPGTRREGSAHHLFPVVFDTRRLGLAKREMLTFFHERGIRCQVHYTPLHLLGAFGTVAPELRTSFPSMDDAFPGLVSLPLWYGLGDTDQKRVIDAVEELVGTRRAASI